MKRSVLLLASLLCGSMLCGCIPIEKYYRGPASTTPAISAPADTNGPGQTPPASPDTSPGESPDASASPENSATPGESASPEQTPDEA